MGKMSMIVLAKQPQLAQLQETPARQRAAKGGCYP
jgi:hypothetical protein